MCPNVPLRPTELSVGRSTVGRMPHTRLWNRLLVRLGLRKRKTYQDLILEDKPIFYFSGHEGS